MADRSRLALRASLLLNLLLAALGVALVLQNRALKRGEVGSHAALRPGDHVPGFAIRGLDQHLATFRYDDPRRRTLIFVFSTTCPFCEESLPNLESAARPPLPGDVASIGVSIHGAAETARFARDHHLGFTVVCAESSDAFQRGYHIAGVPTTILVDGSGVVRNVWEGDITPAMADDIRKALTRS